MIEYETQAIEIAKNTLYAYWAADVIALFALIVLIIGGVLAYKNLKAILGQLEIAQWNSLLSFEQDMANRRSKFSEIAIKMQDPEASNALLQPMFDEAKESYFNSLDRLSSSILNGHFPDREMKQDYQEVIMNVVRSFPDDFGTGTRYRKIVKLYNRWQDE